MRIILLMCLFSDRDYESVRNIDKTNALILIFEEFVLVKINDKLNASSDSVLIRISNGRQSKFLSIFFNIDVDV